MITRRQFAASTPWLVASPLALSGCSPGPAADGYEAVCRAHLAAGCPATDLGGAALGAGTGSLCHPGARPATTRSAGSSRSSANGRSITHPARPGAPLPRGGPGRPSRLRFAGLRRREPDPGRAGPRPQGRGAVRRRRRRRARGARTHARAGHAPVHGHPARANARAATTTASRLSSEELALLQRAGSSDTVRLLLLTERPAMEQTLDYVDSRQHRAVGRRRLRQGAEGLDPLQRRRCGAHARRAVQRVLGQPEHPDLDRRPGLSAGSSPPKGENDKIRAAGAQFRRHRGVRRPGRRQGALGGGGALLRALRAAGHGAGHPQRLPEPAGRSGGAAAALRRRARA